MTIRRIPGLDTIALIPLLVNNFMPLTCKSTKDTLGCFLLVLDLLKEPRLAALIALMAVVLALFCAFCACTTCRASQLAGGKKNNSFCRLHNSNG